ncbi:C39 family peptidase [Mycobacterium asiaticum]|uniref:Peptidase C39-like domain-containing protein n=1 Tax=Mycobacterium asiaticum TaxID=1790 RepID=A0A1A3CJ73_MYCAS|nr:C39 family peptidase [Mycobacterium asiaticum]OBI86412.1 hypothetical protein A9X01_16760 [Mycobacterium asiaticum]
MRTWWKVAATVVVAAGIAAGVGGSVALCQAANVTGMYGDPAAAAPYWRMQTYDDCALMASADVIGQLTGREPAEQEVIAVAQRLPSQVRPGPLYAAGYGTEPADIPLLLAQYGVHGALDSGPEALQRYLSDGHKVIAGVNAELLWGLPVQNRDQSGNPTSDHAVVVTGIDLAHATMHLNDSGNPHGRDETVSLEVFVRSWASGGEQLVVAWTAR